jgi:hypothetical protein
VNQLAPPPRLGPADDQPLRQSGIAIPARGGSPERRASRCNSALATGMQLSVPSNSHRRPFGTLVTEFFLDLKSKRFKIVGLKWVGHSVGMKLYVSSRKSLPVEFSFPNSRLRSAPLPVPDSSRTRKHRCLGWPLQRGPTRANALPNWTLLGPLRERLLRRKCAFAITFPAAWRMVMTSRPTSLIASNRMSRSVTSSLRSIEAAPGPSAGDGVQHASKHGEVGARGDPGELSADFDPVCFLHHLPD